MKLLTSIAISIVAIAPIFANDGAMGEVGGALNYSKNKQIQMVSEDIRIRMFDDFMKVEATYRFKNHGDKTTITMGYPDEGYNMGDKVITAFQSTVNGQPVKVSYQQLASEDEGIVTKGVWTKKVNFSKNETKTVKVWVTAINGGSVQMDRGNRYILTTGATWRGPIQTCTITVDWTNVKNYSAPHLEFYKEEWPPILKTWSKVGPKSKTITLKNIRPDFNLDITMVPGFYNFEINGQKIPIFYGIMTGPVYPQRQGSDIVFPVSGLEHLFSRKTKDDYLSWGNPVCKKWGGSFSIENDVLICENGKRFKLKKGTFSKKVAPFTEPTTFVHLQDVIQALGGKYSYDAKNDVVKINF